MIELKPLPHREAIAYFRSKGLAPQLQRFHHLDHWREEHARNFVVAKGMRDDVLQLIRDELDRALSEGQTLRQFQAELQPALEKAGWWGRKTMVDPLTGEPKEVQLGSLRRLRTIYDTNMRTAHAAGHWARIQRTKAAFPYLHYIQIERPSKRHSHERYHDKIWRVDDPIWLRIYPPNGYFCGCHVLQRTEGWMRRNGRVVSDPIDLEERPFTNKRSGEVVTVPKGVHPGFDSNPGATWLDIEARVEAVMPDLTPERRAYERGLLQQLRLRQTALGRESLVISDVAGENHVMVDATVAAPSIVSVDEHTSGGAFADIPIALLHSHLEDAPLSYQDLQTLRSPRVRAITAVSPGGAIWRARPAQAVMGDQFGRFARRAGPLLQTEMAPLSDNDTGYLLHHALGLFLEREGVIHYHYSLTGRLSDLFERHADLIERLMR